MELTVLSPSSCARENSRDADGSTGIPEGPPPSLVLDRAYLRSVTMGDDALEAEIFDLVATQLASTRVGLATAATTREWSFATHTLKGSALAIGAQQLAILSTAAEKAQPADRPRHRQRLDDAIAALLVEVTRR